MNIHHRINYIEMQAGDFGSVKDFYGSVFGWTFTDYGPDYTAFNDGALDGGFAKGNKRAQGSPLVILYSDNLEKTRDAVTAAGGTLLQDIYVFPGGRRFHFADPAGNELAAWSER